MPVLPVTVVALMLAASPVTAAPKSTAQGATPKTVPPKPVVVERFAYVSDGLSIQAVTCRPDRQAGRPLLNLVHGGLSSPVDLKVCERFARLGYVVAASGLRGQAGSAGRVEACIGEANDVLTLRRIAQDRYRTDARRVAYLGVSLGGCIAVKAAARDRDVRATVALLTPVNLAEQLDLLRSTRPDAVPRWEAILGRTPQAAREGAERRSPVVDARVLTSPLLVVAAGNDPLIPVRQSCLLRDARVAAGKRVVEIRQTRDGLAAQPDARPSRRCDNEQPQSDLPSLRGADVHLVYTDLAHTSTPRMWNVAEAYLKANIDPPTPWECFLRFLRLR